jgi:addiction module RelE/StbE family toxin
MFLYSAHFTKQFRKLNDKTQTKIEKCLSILVNYEFNPSLNNHRLHGEYSKYRSINITGDIRLVYQKIDENTYFLVDVGTHSQLYK